MKTAKVLPSVLLIGTSLVLACGESRTDRLKRQFDYDKKAEEEKPELPEEVPPHPMREKLRPLLTKLYSQDKLPAVLEADVEGGQYGYELQAGVLSVVRLQQGITPDQMIRAIIMATAEADAWAYRSNARRPYADLIHRVKRGYGDDQQLLVLKAYADLKLLNFFNGPDAEAAVNALPEDVKGTAQAMRGEYMTGKQAVWDRWMVVKMYARRVVSGDEPFRPLLRGIKKELGHEEPPPRTWLESMDAPFKGWATEIAANEELMTKLTNLRELRQREEFSQDTHSLWVMAGSAMVPDKAKKLKPSKDLGFAALREDLGGGYNDMTFVFSKKLSGNALKKAFVRSVIYGHMLSDFQMLSTAGSDFAERDADNVIDATTAVVPDKYDPLYAKCGSGAAVDTFIIHYGEKHAFLQGLKPGIRDAEKILSVAHDCVVEGARGEIHVPAEDDDKDVEGAAPGSRLALYQMLARFESVDVNMAAMGSQEPTEEDETISEGEAILKKIRQKKEAGKGVK